MAHPLMHETIWFDRTKFEEAETKYQEHVASQHSGLVVQKSEGPASNLVSEIARARQNIQNSLSAGVGLNVGVGVENPELIARLSAVEKENQDLRKITTDLQAAVASLTERLNALSPGTKPSQTTTAPSAPVQNGTVDDDDDDDDDDDFDCFGDDDDDEVDEEKEKITQQRLAEYAARKAKKPTVIAKSNIILDVKPWDDETDMKDVEKAVRSIQTDGLKWGASKLVPLAYGIKKLQITCVVEDDKVGTDYLEEEITKFEDLVQSMDIAAFNKV